MDLIDTTVVGGPDVAAAVKVAPLGSGRRIDVTLHNGGHVPARVERVGIVIESEPSGQVLEHGWQSWSVVRRCSPADVRPDRAGVPGWAAAVGLADAGRAGHTVAGDHFLVTGRGLVGFLDGRRHLSTVEVQRDGWLLTAWALLDGILLAPGEQFELDPVWVAAGEPATLYREFASRWASVSGARPAPKPPLGAGWCSWYEYFGQVTPDDARANLRVAAAHGLGLFQLDDGWQGAIGDWLSHAPAWHGRDRTPAAVAAGITAAGMRAGLWTAPFLAGESSALVREHPDWLVRHRPTGRPLRAMHNPAWGGWAYALDTTRPEVLDHLRQVYGALREQGFDYHKIDFCYAAAMPGERFGDASITRGQALVAGLGAVREGIGEDAFLLGCGCPFGPAVGLVDAMRVSADVAPYWEPKRSWPGFAESAPAAVNAIQASVLRAPLHRRLWLNDPDCLLLRPTGTELSAQQREVLYRTIGGTGAYTVLSDQLDRYTPSEWSLVDDLCAAMAERDVPLEIEDVFSPAVTVKGGPWSVTVDWAVPARAVREG